MSEMPDLPSVPCCMGGDGCACGDSERVLRFLSGQAHDIVLSEKQREWCLKEIGSVEGYDRADHATSPTPDLARTVLEAWTDYARDKGLL